jgi:Stage II sporulation protein
MTLLDLHRVDPAQKLLCKHKLQIGSERLDCTHPISISELNAEGASIAAPKTFFISGNYQIIPENGPAFSGNFPLQIKRSDSGFQVTVFMPIEQYISAVLAAESGASKNDESLKAMAVAIRTYATRFHGQHVQDGFDFCDTTHCQTMKWNSIDSRNRAAVLATRGGASTLEGVYNKRVGISGVENWWARQDSNLGPTDYESAALTD